MASNIHELLKVSLSSAMPDPSTPCGRATPETTLRPFLGWPTGRAGDLQPSSWIPDAVRAWQKGIQEISQMLSMLSCLLIS
jgi:hypothetical protein